MMRRVETLERNPTLSRQAKEEAPNHHCALIDAQDNPILELGLCPDIRFPLLDSL